MPGVGRGAGCSTWNIHGWRALPADRAPGRDRCVSGGAGWRTRGVAVPDSPWRCRAAGQPLAMPSGVPDSHARWPGGTVLRRRVLGASSRDGRARTECRVGTRRRFSRPAFAARTRALRRRGLVEGVARGLLGGECAPADAPVDGPPVLRARRGLCRRGFARVVPRGKAVPDSHARWPGEPSFGAESSARARGMAARGPEPGGNAPAVFAPAFAARTRALRRRGLVEGSRVPSRRGVRACGCACGRPPGPSRATRAVSPRRRGGRSRCRRRGKAVPDSAGWPRAVARGTVLRRRVLGASSRDGRARTRAGWERAGGFRAPRSLRERGRSAGAGSSEGSRVPSRRGVRACGCACGRPPGPSRATRAVSPRRRDARSPAGRRCRTATRGGPGDRRLGAGTRCRTVSGEMAVAGVRCRTAAPVLRTRRWLAPRAASGVPRGTPAATCVRSTRPLVRRGSRRGSAREGPPRVVRRRIRRRHSRASRRARPSLRVPRRRSVPGAQRRGRENRRRVPSRPSSARGDPATCAEDAAPEGGARGPRAWRSGAPLCAVRGPPAQGATRAWAGQTRRSG